MKKLEDICEMLHILALTKRSRVIFEKENGACGASRKAGDSINLKKLYNQP